MPDSFFDFSRRERQGIACLLILIVIFQCLPAVWLHIRPLPPPADTLGMAEAERAVAGLLAEGAREKTRRHDSMRASWKGKSYRKDSAFRKPWQRDTARKKSWERKPPPVIGINAADSAEWERLPYIGAGYAGRIVRFRNRLGGFHSVIQVGETYGLPDSVFKKIQPYLRLGDESLRKIDVNETDEKSLADHPYINTKLARAIIRYRSANGRFRQVSDLMALPLVNDSIYRKIEKYLIAP
ncbi:ComEA family DNA-binding protein [Chitinophaga rhizosphaerae]|uniref:ComEA family DNA-binding protein n=1 Tax=Chitinophaga rhizosphaerae TaxID=1864947 RepID=UPI000F8107C4|nr:helix-hairpin-helix domain-containing protein [Chitinophaga rhizosphaerae]